VKKLQENDWRGEIVGPHGSGKSTLLQTLSPVIEAAGRKVRSYVAKPNDKQLPMSAVDLATWNESTQVVIEGYELLSRRSRKSLDRACRDRNAGLLITCHAPQGLPTLFHTTVTVELATSLVEQLLPSDCDFISAADVRDSFARQGQNLRELLFEMYDLYEQRRPR
jgi:energy-coupling factor transporter ATP-binding protein EcfA2